LYPLQEKMHIFAAILRSFGLRRQNFNTRFEVGQHMPVKFYPEPLRFAGVICEKLILSKIIGLLRCDAYA